MLVLPAIDLKNGEVVRLYKGDYEKKTVYSTEPEKLALVFEKMGAKYIHIVDLDGAKNGKSMNLEVIKKIRDNISIPIELGGGIRDEQTIDLYLNKIGINRIIIGTAAINNPKFLYKILNKYGSEKIVVGVDVKENCVLVSGWLKNSKINYLDFIKKLEDMGVKYIVVTDIKSISSMNIIVSGGIKDAKDICKIKELNYYGCIVGKAYYEKKVNLLEVIKCLEKE